MGNNDKLFGTSEGQLLQAVIIQYPLTIHCLWVPGSPVRGCGFPAVPVIVRFLAPR